jgi:hypothetical protein
MYIHIVESFIHVYWRIPCIRGTDGICANPNPSVKLTAMLQTRVSQTYGKNRICKLHTFIRCKRVETTSYPILYTLLQLKFLVIVQ